jgi:putative ABC transport system permease protein
LKEGDETYVSKYYELLAGEYPHSATDLVLVVDTKNQIDLNILKALGFDTDNATSIKFSDIVGTEFKIISNNAYYVKTEFGTYLPGHDYEAMYASDKSITLKIVGVVRQKRDVNMGLLASGIAYSDDLSQMVIDDGMNSDIVKAQESSNKNIISMEDMDAITKSAFVSYLGGNATPFMVLVFPDNFDDKDAVTAYLDAYNEGKDIADQVVYTDLAGTMAEMTGGIMDGITIVLIAFAAISLIVSLIMISIITYTSVLERTKEIGILRSLGARKKDITLVFDAETCILGLLSGILGIAIASALTIPVNQILFNLTELEGVSHLQVPHAVLLVVVSTVLAVLGGHIPAKIASNKDPVEALRTE